MVSLEDVERAQQEWGDGIVAISGAHRNGGDYIGIATNHINTLYAYQIGPVMFKPTLAAVDQFRPTFEPPCPTSSHRTKLAPRTKDLP